MSCIILVRKFPITLKYILQMLATLIYDMFCFWLCSTNQTKPNQTKKRKKTWKINGKFCIEVKSKQKWRPITRKNQISQNNIQKLKEMSPRQ